VETPPGPAVASVHPEDVLLFLEPPVAGATTLRNVVEATVREIQSSGRSSRVVLDWAGGRLDASVTRAACDELDIHAGQIVHAAVKATAIQVLPRSVGR
jgi:molybdopterin-binding protein